MFEAARRQAMARKPAPQHDIPPALRPPAQPRAMASFGHPAHRPESPVWRRRTALDLTLKEVGRRVGVSQVAVWQWEAGKTTPRLTHLPRLATALGVSVPEVVGWFTASVPATPAAAD
jgi:DNA-binding XRE family transcriptional regulator